MGMHPVQVIAVTGGKGGVGKTNVSVNLSLALADLGRRVMLLDADLGLANVDVLLGLTAKRTLADVINGECDLRDVLLQGPGGIRIVPAASGTQSMVQLSPMQHAGLIQAFSEISDNLDVLVIDTAAGIGDSVVSFVRAAQEVIVVVCDEPASVTDAYADLAGGTSAVALEYEPEWRRAGLAAALAAAREDDVRRGVSTVGPHRDDVAIMLSGMPARTHASQGEQRTLALALRLAAHRLVAERTGSTPVLVLDDVLSELDPDRATALLANLPAGQVVITSASPLPEAAHPDRVLEIAAGTVAVR